MISKWCFGKMEFLFSYRDKWINYFTWHIKFLVFKYIKKVHWSDLSAMSVYCVKYIKIKVNLVKFKIVANMRIV